MLVSGVEPWWRWHLYLTEGGYFIVVVPVAPFIMISRCLCSVITMIAWIISMVTWVITMIAQIIAMVALTDSTIMVGVFAPEIGWSLSLVGLSYHAF